MFARQTALTTCITITCAALRARRTCSQVQMLALGPSLEHINIRQRAPTSPSQRHVSAQLKDTAEPTVEYILALAFVRIWQRPSREMQISMQNLRMIFHTQSDIEIGSGLRPQNHGRAPPLGVSFRPQFQGRNLTVILWAEKPKSIFLCKTCP